MRKAFSAIVLSLCVLCTGVNPGQDESFELPAAVEMTLKRLEETYHVLDNVSENIWPGWTNYRDFPFLFEFENRLRVLVGHPNPPENFETLPGVKVGGSDVYVDTSRLTPMELEDPLRGGGGILPYGRTAEGEPIRIVSISLRCGMPGQKEEERFRTETQITLYIHELFHCFQRGQIQRGYGNLHYNPNADYALHSEIEGLALRKAYLEEDLQKSREHIKDFLVARELKRRSMTDMQQKQESSDDLMEGTAVYSEVRALESIAEGFMPKLSTEEDPYYSGFQNMDGLMARYRERMQGSLDEVYDPKMKCYDYGCHQALLLQRHFPGWQEAFTEKTGFLDEELQKRFPVSEEEKEEIQKRFEVEYGLSEIKERIDSVIEERDAAYAEYKGRQGKAYIISFKEIKEYVASRIDEDYDHSKLGLINFYPQGLGSFQVNEISFKSGDGSAVLNQLYYIKYIDGDWKEREDPVKLDYEGEESDGVFTGATIMTPFFTLKAPKVRIKDSENRYKIWVLSRMKDD